MLTAGVVPGVTGHKILDRFWEKFLTMTIDIQVPIMCPNFWTYLGHILDTYFKIWTLSACYKAIVQNMSNVKSKFGCFLDTKRLFGQLMDIIWTHFGFGHISDVF